MTQTPRIGYPYVGKMDFSNYNKVLYCTLFGYLHLLFMFLTLPELDFSWLNLFRVVVDTATFCEGDFIFTQILASLLHASYNSILLHKRDFDVSK